MKKDNSFIRRQKQTSNFTVLPNDIFKQQMSLKAIGLLCFLLHLPDDWVIVKTELHKRFKDGRDATTGAFNELLKIGYITESEIRSKGKFAGKDFFVHDEIQYQPLTENPSTVKPSTVKPSTVKPSTVKPSTENPTLLNTNNKKELNKQELKGQSSVNKLTGDEPDFELNGTEYEIIYPEDQEIKSPPVPQPPPNNYVLLMAVYYDWYKERVGVKPAIDGVEGKALKALQSYFEGIARDKLKEENIVETEQAISDKAIDILSYILHKWDRLEPFLRKQVKLAQISSNITNIINYLKNGTKQQSTQQAKGDRAGTIADGFAGIENAFRG